MAKMRVTYHNGRSNKQGVYSSKHNDRNFEVENASHIEPEQAENNAYWHIYQNESPQMSFDAVEEKFYGEHFGEFLEARNNRYLAQRQKKRVQSMADYRKSQKSCPEETIMQVGNKNQSVSKEKMCRIFNEYIRWQHKKYPQLATLNCAYHGDEQGAGHIHIRQVWIAHDQDGREMVHQGQSLAEMGVERPKPEKKESRYNNAKMVFTKKSREKIIEIARSFGVEIEDKAQDASKSGKDLLAWQVERDNIRRDEAKAELQKAVEEHKETLEAITKAEVYLAGISKETEKEKKRAEEIKALADAEAKRLVDLRDADAERQRQEIAQKQRLENLKNEANKEKVRAEKNKMLADEAEARLRQAAEYQQQVANDLEILRLQTEEAIENKGKSIQIISRIAEPIIEVSSAIDERNQNKVWLAVQNLIKAFKTIVDDIPILRLIKDNHSVRNTDEYKNQQAINNNLQKKQDGWRN